MLLRIACDHIAGLWAASESASLGDADPSQPLAGLIRPHLGQRLTSILPPLSHEHSASMLLIRRYVMAITYVFGERRFTAATDKPSQNCGLARTNNSKQRSIVTAPNPVPPPFSPLAHSDFSPSPNAATAPGDKSSRAFLIQFPHSRGGKPPEKQSRRPPRNAR
jgi:hypothetical protein